MFVDEVRSDSPHAAWMGDLKLTSRATIVTGPNGCGKSTLLESIAVAMGANPTGGSRHARFNAMGGASRALPITVRRSENPRDVFFLRGESFFDLEEYHRSLGENRPEVSHGQGIMRLARSRFGQGLLLLDEPEDGLSVLTQLELLGLLTVLVRRGTQLIMATHSPVLMAIPGAQLLDERLEPVLFDASPHTQATREFIADPHGTAEYLVAGESDVH